ncbi:glycosyltransferase [Bernardetia litoralis DSM 6794]|uniref:Glycosyltransferase n=1 Tax=Bernardetia litoralis (strain ATCC 23117 / DSM 6794 / NBRC 15988 / NCIMB 1366 / Fx l1 / Sio-4) TaxID=880071 RepID=I4AJ42_BERLS|nr:glycosyltransferase family 4 protein [Bernardetia litoralis]AFM03977.1 glycosyltransferase [Bernardetia litoralis DSM 6794]
MKQIAIFSPNYSPELGACASRIQYLAECLQKEGNQVTVYTTFPNYPTGNIFFNYRNLLFKKIIHKENINGIKVIRFSFYPSNSSSSFVRLFSMLTLALSWFFALPSLKKQHPDAILVQSPPLLPVFTVWFLSKIITKKRYSPALILNVSDLYPRVLLDLDKIKGHTIYNLLLNFETFLYKKMNFIIGQSDEIVDYIQKIVPSIPTLLYRNGVDSEVFKIKKIYNIKEVEPIKLVYAGLLGVAQGILEVLEHVDFEEINAELHIYGDGNERALIDSFIKNNFLNTNKKQTVFLYNPIPSKEIAKKLADYDAAIIIQKKQILGTVPSKIYEAMAAGLPILLCGSGESADLIKKYDLGIVLQSIKNQQINYELLSQEIRNLKTLSPEKRKIFGQNGREIAKTIFDKKTQFKNIKKIFD